jgi:hypothetical protein
MNRFLSFLALFTGFALLVLFITVGAGYFSKPPKEPGDDTTLDDLIEFIQKSTAGELVSIHEDLAEMTAASTFRMTDEQRKNLRQSPTSTTQIKTQLTQIPELNAVIKTYGRSGELSPFAFVDEKRQNFLKEILGDSLSPQQIIQHRQRLTKVISAFNYIRDQDEWNIKVSGGGDPPPLWLMKTISKPTQMIETHPQPRLYLKPAVPCFSNEDADALQLISDYHNSEPFTKAFPKAKFPKLYDRNGKIPPFPTAAVKAYRTEMEKVILLDRAELFPDGKPPEEYAKAVDEILDRFRAYLNTLAELE